MENRCEYEEGGKCYLFICLEKGYCKAKGNRANNKEIIEWIKKKRGMVVPNVVVKKPNVVNKSFPSENVAPE